MTSRNNRVKEYLAYQGTKYTIEWYFNPNGHSQSLGYFEQLTPKRQDKLIYLFKMMADFGRISDITKFRNEGDGIYAFKPQPDRFLCFFFRGKTNYLFKKKNGFILPRTI
jgi:hypothetical protein